MLHFNDIQSYSFNEFQMLVSFEERQSSWKIRTFIIKMFTCLLLKQGDDLETLFSSSSYRFCLGYAINEPIGRQKKQFTFFHMKMKISICMKSS